MLLKKIAINKQASVKERNIKLDNCIKDKSNLGVSNKKTPQKKNITPKNKLLSL